MSSTSAEKALEFKNEGNKYIKAQDYAHAIEMYDKAIELDATQSIYFSNRALGHLKIDNFQHAAHDCDEALRLDPKNFKAYHRRGLARVGLLEFKKARNDLNIVLKAKPSDGAAKRALDICEKVIREERFRKAIGGDDGDSKVRLCRTLNIGSFDANSDLAKYEGPTLEFEQLYNDKNEYAGAKVKNMSQEFISEMVNDVFLKGKNLPKKYAAAIVSHAERLFSAEPNMLELSNKERPDHKISVCGDTHGQFYDVLNIFKKFGKVSKYHTYLFNGDFVDRGSWSCEVALLFYALKILYPENMFLNRGNHETDNMNKIYGFEDECKYKYSQRLFDLFSQSFETLPLATLINKDYLVMHGGLPSDKTSMLEDINKLDRFSQPPREGLYMELLWSDPQQANGLGPSQRGLGFAFGPDITEDYLKRNNLKKVFRSHEVRMRGILFEHNNKLATVFSAPNYCDSQGNMGGIIHIVPGKGKLMQNGNDDEDLVVETFEAVKHPDMKPMAYSSGGLGF
ncbi:Serine/threonine-protein phosphatase T [Nakaseomyces bracarensis]|uniref:Serine/threonine-protein phosphatase n=1 Tax=Nakaseomyces bracarensis TaxID=273131 RepID=A0ABR4P0K0_9SACH